METSATQVTVVTNQNILQEIKRRGTTKNAVARKAGIPATTFDRKINGVNDFTLPELGAVAEALGLELIDILPADLLTSKVAA